MRTRHLATAAAAALVVVSGCTPSDRDEAVAPPTDPLAAMLLSETEANVIVAPTTLTNTFTYRKLFTLDAAKTYTPAECLAVPANTMSEVFEDSGFRKVRGAQLDADEGGANIDQGVIEFGTPAAAHAMVDRTVQTWRRCAGSVLTIDDDDGTSWQPTMRRPETADGVDMVVVEDSSGYVSTHAMRVVDNLVIDVRASDEGVSEHAVAMVNAIAGRDTL